MRGENPQIFCTLDIIDEPLTAFVRLEEGIIMPNALEIPLPMRFIFLLLTPKNSSFIDCHEVGRSFSALMSNRKFHNVCYGIEGKEFSIEGVCFSGLLLRRMTAATAAITLVCLFV